MLRFLPAPALLLGVLVRPLEVEVQEEGTLVVLPDWALLALSLLPLLRAALTSLGDRLSTSASVTSVLLLGFAIVMRRQQIRPTAVDKGDNERKRWARGQRRRRTTETSGSACECSRKSKQMGQPRCDLWKEKLSGQKILHIKAWF